MRVQPFLMLVVAIVLAASSTSAQQPQRPVLDISGMWTHNDLMTEDRAVLINRVGGGARIGDYTGIPLNDAGRQQADSWMAARLEMPEHQCHPHPTQYSFWGPGNFRISNIFDPLTDRIIGFTLAGTFGRADRTIWLDGRPHPPANARHTWAGFSTGEWDGNQLTITTTHLKEGWIQRNGIQVSDRATVREHIIRHDNYITFISVVNDPEHLEEPFIRSTQAVYDPTTILGPAECQPFHTNVVNAEHERGSVPHWLPGQNPQLREFSESFGVPYEAARGGARTLYPEYQAELKRLIERDKRNSSTATTSS